ncbi:MAG: hypothetical protein JWQ01_3295 [Massilia sp.]|jgi:hypothetical protein|nr:hypothetical protein [Massilia sp.]
MTLRPCAAIDMDGKTCGLTSILTESEKYGIHILASSVLAVTMARRSCSRNMNSEKR